MNQHEFSKFPNTLHDKIADRLHLSTTALIRVKVDEYGREDARHIGSGTFVLIEDSIHGILIARHVTQMLDGPCQLGLSVSTNPHALKIDRNHLQIVDVAIPTEDEYGPDLSFIVLSTWDVSTIKASLAVFHSLTPDREELLHRPPPLDAGMWLTCGVPAEMTVDEPAEAGFDSVIAFQHFTGVGYLDKEFMRGDYDYAEMVADYSPSKNLPVSFGGMSGGGLWQVLIGQTQSGELHPLAHLLSGVVFYQSEFKNYRRSIRCHFRHSLYKHMYGMIVAKFT